MVFPVVYRVVDLQNQIDLGTIEIDDEAVNDVLTTELETKHSPATQE